MSCGAGTTYIDSGGSLRCEYCDFLVSPKQWESYKACFSAQEIKVLEDRSAARLQKISMQMPAGVLPEKNNSQGSTD